MSIRRTVSRIPAPSGGTIQIPRLGIAEVTERWMGSMLTSLVLAKHLTSTYPTQASSLGAARRRIYPSQLSGFGILKRNPPRWAGVFRYIHCLYIQLTLVHVPLHRRHRHACQPCTCREGASKSAIVICTRVGEKFVAPHCLCVINPTLGCFFPTAVLYGVTQ